MPHREPRSASNEARLISALPMQDTPTPQAFYQALCPWNHYVLYVQYTEAHTYNQQRDYGGFQGSISRFRAEPLKSILQEHISRLSPERRREGVGQEMGGSNLSCTRCRANIPRPQSEPRIRLGRRCLTKFARSDVDLVIDLCGQENFLMTDGIHDGPLPVKSCTRP